MMDQQQASKLAAIFNANYYRMADEFSDCGWYARHFPIEGWAAVRHLGHRTGKALVVFDPPAWALLEA
jgi:hypothetical protein